jgi:hypothetical protein
MTLLNTILAVIAGCLILFAATVTILDYTNKGKHIDRDKW